MKESKRDRYIKFFDMAYDMTGDVEEARHMTAQMAHESAGFKKFEEDPYYTIEGMRKSSKSKGMTDKELKEISPKYKGSKKKFFDWIYSNREDLGTGEGEGHKYYGRGAIQVTGKKNYDKFNINPEELSDPITDEQAFDMSARWWNENIDFSDKSKEAISNKVNSKEPKEHRLNRYSRYGEVDKKIGDYINAIKQRMETKKLDKQDMFNTLYPEVKQ